VGSPKVSEKPLDIAEAQSRYFKDWI